MTPSPASQLPGDQLGLLPGAAACDARVISVSAPRSSPAVPVDAAAGARRAGPEPAVLRVPARGEGAHKGGERYLWKVLSRKFASFSQSSCNNTRNDNRSVWLGHRGHLPPAVTLSRATELTAAFWYGKRTTRKHIWNTLLIITIFTEQRKIGASLCQEQYKGQRADSSVELPV